MIGVWLAAGLLLAAAVPGRAAEERPARNAVVSTGKRVELRDHLRREGTTLFVFLSEASTVEQAFLEELERRLPPADSVVIRQIRLKGLDAPAARQHEVTATPLVVVLDRFGKPLARTAVLEEALHAAARGRRMGRIRWIDEEDPAAPETYGRTPEQLRRGLPGIVKTMSLRKDVMQVFMQLSRIHFSDGFLTRREHELIAAYVSALNRCRF